ncbi:hypothetical protein [Streptomyces sp. AcH 505]|uniref:hypothetical protein n=1 Tax=Streptomyces sp. AcH 505 TaxID=352211 RepID=UPI0012FF4A82
MKKILRSQQGLTTQQLAEKIAREIRDGLRPDVRPKRLPSKKTARRKAERLRKTIPPKPTREKRATPAKRIRGGISRSARKPTKKAVTPEMQYLRDWAKAESKKERGKTPGVRKIVPTSIESSRRKH